MPGRKRGGGASADGAGQSTGEDPAAAAGDAGVGVQDAAQGSTDTAAADTADAATQDAVQPQAQADDAVEVPDDVTIHDMLDTDVASVTSLTVSEIQTGVAPFDKDDTAGNDSSESNMIVRSFDRVTYTLKTVVTSDSVMDYYRSARIGFTVHLPAKDKAQLDTKNMGWVDQTPGYTPKTVTRADGSQDVTVYRLLEATSSTPTSVPGTYELPFPVAVQGMVQGDQLQPVFTAFTVPNDSGRKTVVTPQPVTVSSRPQFNVHIDDTWPETMSSGGANEWDFTTADSDAKYYPSDTLNSELGKQTGTLSKVAWNVEMMADDPAKGAKGTEYPKAGTPITFSLHVANRMQLLKGGTKSDAAFQPYFWMVYSADGNQNPTRASVMNAIWAERRDYSRQPYATKPGTSTQKRNIYNAGHMQVTQTRTASETVFTITTDDWSTDPDRFPIRVANYGTTNCSTQIMFGTGTAPCDEYKRKIVSGGELYWFNPTAKDGQSAVNLYHDSVTVKQAITTPTMSVTGMSGATSTRQSATNDDKAALAQLIEPPGSFSMDVRYACSTLPWAQSYPNGTDCAGWNAQDAKSGTDKSYPGALIRITTGSTTTHNNVAALAPVFSVNLLKFDDKLLEFDGADLHLTSPVTNLSPARAEWDASASGNTPSYEDSTSFKYAVKPDGAGWKNDAEQATARIGDLDYYDTYEEAKQHGTPVGLLMVNHDTSPLRNRTKLTQPSFMLRVKTSAPVGQTAQITQEAHAYTRQDLVNHAVTPEGLVASSSRDDWYAWAKTQDPIKLNETVPYTYSAYSDHYKKSTYDKDGNYIPGTEGVRYGDTLLIAGERLTINIYTNQTGADGKGKTLYDLDKDERYADWIVSTQVFKQTDAMSLDTTVTVKVQIPKGLTLVDGSVHWDGKYTANTPGAGTVEGGTIPTLIGTEPKPDGSTWYTYEIENVPVDNGLHELHLTTLIGDPSDPDNDSANGQSYTLNAQIMSTRDLQPPQHANHKAWYRTITVSRTKASQLATRANPLINDVDQPVGFTSMVVNSAQNDRKDVLAIDQLPANGKHGSSYHGTLGLQSLALTASGLEVDGNVRVFASTAAKYRDVEPDAISRSQVESDDFTELAVGQDGTVSFPAGFDAAATTVLALLIDRMPSGSRVDTTIGMNTAGNRPRDLYVNRWSDMDNTVSAMSTVANRSVSGVVFVDADRDGGRADTDRRVPQVTVRMVSATDSANRTITLLDGTTAQTTTDKQGAYRFDNVPAGNYRLIFTPEDTGGWAYYRLTAKQADGIGSAVNSDADQQLTLNELTAASITLDPMPTLSQLASSNYSTVHMDVGLIRVAADESMPLTGQVPALYVLLVLGVASMIGASIIMLKRQ